MIKFYLSATFLLQIFDFDRDYKDVGVALFTTKYFVVRNCLPNAKSDMVLSAWNPPPDWGKYALSFYLFVSFSGSLGIMPIVLMH